MRLIDADRARQTAAIDLVVHHIDRQPTIDAVPVVHSKWIGFPNNGVWDMKCDKCHRIIPFGQTPDTMYYCPSCGARMDGEEYATD